MTVLAIDNRLRKYPIRDLQAHLDLIRAALTELYAANAATPYDHERYTDAEQMRDALVLHLCDGNRTQAAGIGDHLRDWSGEAVGAWFVANWCEQQWEDSDANLNGITVASLRRTR